MNKSNRVNYLNRDKSTYKVISFEKDGKTVYYTGREKLDRKQNKWIWCSTSDISKVLNSGRFFKYFGPVDEKTDWYQHQELPIDSFIEVMKETYGLKNVKQKLVKQ